MTGGAKIVDRTLRDAGMEVIYTGIRQSVEQVVNTVIQENADVLGLSFLSGDQGVLLPKVMQALKAKDAEDVMVIAGGIIPERQIPEFMKMGVRQVFLPGTPPAGIAKYIYENRREP
jgi:methylmalonyl-CoA mutase C-terminal domain/subunit